MAEHSTKKVIPLEAIPDEGGKTVTIEGENYLLLNDAFYTFFQRSMGEFSPFFLALRDERKILGCKCTSCGIVRIPPFLTRCPECNFAPTKLVEVDDVGKMIATPPITYFANSLFAKQIPYGRGRIVLDGADTAMSINFYTTAGVLVPGAVRKGTEMKVVFRDERRGEITDIFCVPTSELTPEQVAKKGLLESEIRWETATEDECSSASDRVIASLSQRELAAEAGLNTTTVNRIVDHQALGYRNAYNSNLKGGTITWSRSILEHKSRRVVCHGLQLRRI